MDLYVLERALLSTHTGSETLVDRIISAYCASSKHGGAGASVSLWLLFVRQRVPKMPSHLSGAGLSRPARRKFPGEGAVYPAALLDDVTRLHWWSPPRCSRPWLVARAGPLSKRAASRESLAAAIIGALGSVAPALCERRAVH